MKKTLFFLGIMLLSVTLFAQPDYLRKANRFIVQGNYEQARLNLEAHKAYLDSKKTDKNSDDYIALEKKLYRVGRCKELQITAKKATEGYTYAYCDSLISLAENAEAANQIVSNISSSLNRAKGCYSEICNTFPSDTVSANNKDKCIAILEFISNIDFNELEYWRTVMAQNTIEAYQSFIKEYPQSERVKLAKDKVRVIEDNALWQVYLASKTYENCKAYLSTFPDGIYASQASEDFAVLEEDRLWNTASTRDDYNAYLKKYPQGRYASQVMDKIAYIEETDLWKEALSANNISAYNVYLKKYPSGNYSAKAKSLINKIKDKESWSKATSLDTKQAYEAYLQESTLLAYASEAREKIDEFIHQERVATDLARWESIKNSTSWYDFYKYITDKADYRHENHLKDANYKYNIYRAKELYSTGSAYTQVISYLDEAKKYGELTQEYHKIYDTCNEEVLFDAFMANQTESNAVQYLQRYTRRASQINHLMCQNTINQMSLFGDNNSLRAKALRYAKTQDDVDSVEKKFNTYKKHQDKLEKQRQKQSQKIQSQSSSKSYSSSNAKSVRPSNREPFHFMIGADLSYDSEYGDVSVSPLISLGGHSNRLNLEFAFESYFEVDETDFTYWDSSIIVRPRWNIVKLKYKGNSPTNRSASDYTNFYMYAAPEFYMYPFDGFEYDYGVRVGMGIAPFEFYAGYRVEEELAYVGFAIYFSCK